MRDFLLSFPGFEEDHIDFSIADTKSEEASKLACLDSSILSRITQR